MFDFVKNRSFLDRLLNSFTLPLLNERIYITSIASELQTCFAKNYGNLFRRLSCLCISFAKNDKRRKLKDIMKVAALWSYEV